RFDEASNLELANRLQEAGALVVYGVVGYKTHAKMALIVRREEGHLHRYIHVGTGNYNPKTSREYMDISLFSYDQRMTEDVHQIFQ
ncbi:RNA degradosome polyphosphate kinase, partial [Acinetobacter baumannii]